MSDSSRNRVLYYALLASVALHAMVLLFAFPELIESARRAVGFPPPLVARLTEPEPEQQVPTRAEPVAKRPPRLVRPAPESPAVAAPQVAPEKPAPRVEAPAPPAPAAVAPPVAAIEPQPAPPAPPSAAIAEDAQSADRYRMELIAALTRMIKDSYPPQARENNWEGDVLLGVVIRGNGTVSVAVKRGSQFGTLDQRAAELVTQATREVPVPPALRGKESVLKDLLVQYRLRD